MKSEIDAKIERLQEQIKKLELEKQKLKELSPAMKLAEHLHSQHCHWNHTDGCDWDYGNPLDPKAWTSNSTRERYLKWADNILLVIRQYNPTMSIDGALELAMKVHDKNKSMWGK
jgi:hypothetical protein